MVPLSITYVAPHRLAQMKSALVDLGFYGLTHTHSYAWVPAITCLITRRCAHV
jgi:hypothetical protein